MLIVYTPESDAGLGWGLHLGVSQSKPHTEGHLTFGVRIYTVTLFKSAMPMQSPGKGPGIAWGSHERCLCGILSQVEELSKYQNRLLT